MAGAQLQGASLQGAVLMATDLSRAGLWRTNTTSDSQGATKPHDLRAAEAPEWRSLSASRPWDENAYQSFRKTIEAFPPSDSRDQTLNRIRRLDCVSYDTALATCDSNSPGIPLLNPPPEATAWRHAVEVARVEDATYQIALATELKAIVCSDDTDAVYALRGLLPYTKNVERILTMHFVGPYSSRNQSHSRLIAAGAETPTLVDFILSKECPVSALLTGDDRAKLLQIKQEIEAPKAAPK